MPGNPAKVEIELTDNRCSKIVRMIAITLAYVLLPIGLGVIVNSVPMQWVGFAAGLLLLASFIRSGAGLVRRFESVDGAVAYLNNLKK